MHCNFGTGWHRLKLGGTTESEMTGRRSAAMDEAIRLHRSGEKTYKAAQQTGVSPSALYRAIKKDSKQKEQEWQESRTEPSV